MSNSRSNPGTSDQLREACEIDAERGSRLASHDTIDDLELIEWDKQRRKWAALRARIEADTEQRQLIAYVAKREVWRRDATLVIVVAALLWCMLAAGTQSHPELPVALTLLGAWALRGATAPWQGGPNSTEKSHALEARCRGNRR